MDAVVGDHGDRRRRAEVTLQLTLSVTGTTLPAVEMNWRSRPEVLATLSLGALLVCLGKRVVGLLPVISLVLSGFAILSVRAAVGPWDVRETPLAMEWPYVLPSSIGGPLLIVVEADGGSSTLAVSADQGDSWTVHRPATALLTGASVGGRIVAAARTNRASLVFYNLDTRQTATNTVPQVRPGSVFFVQDHWIAIGTNGWAGVAAAEWPVKSWTVGPMVGIPKGSPDDVVHRLGARTLVRFGAQAPEGGNPARLRIWTAAEASPFAWRDLAVSMDLPGFRTNAIYANGYWVWKTGEGRGFTRLFVNVDAQRPGGEQTEFSVYELVGESLVCRLGSSARYGAYSVCGVSRGHWIVVSPGASGSDQLIRLIRPNGQLTEEPIFPGTTLWLAEDSAGFKVRGLSSADPTDAGTMRNSVYTSSHQTVPAGRVAVSPASRGGVVLRAEGFAPHDLVIWEWTVDFRAWGPDTATSADSAGVATRPVLQPEIGAASRMFYRAY